MALTAGSRLGSYEILAPLGAGGMGEVYRARDTKLGREVAIKILPAAVASDGDRLARLEREARVLASLNHPNIATLYGLEDAGGVTALVMELVEGETLARRMGDVAIGDPRSIADHPIARSSIRLAEALVIARQIADAFDAAHERGIVHRDLKPANIVIAANGTVKVLDFGLAKETATAAGADALTHSPTMIAPTVDGLLLGTAPYMSPEQARGQAVDKRTDIWAFGCVLYEMLTGHRAFGGETTTDTLAAIIEREPDWAALPSSTSPAIRRLLRKCLQKDVRRRLHDIADARIDIDETIVGAAGDVDSGAATTAPTARARATSALLAVVALAAAAIVGWTAGRRDRSSAAPPSAVDVSLVPLTTDPGYEGEPTFAPDGETVAYVSDRTGNLEIFLKQASGGRDINLTDDPADDIQPAFSPDGRQIAFVSSRSGASSILPYGTDNPLMGGDIWVMPALGGSARRIAQKGNFPSWSPDGSRILYISGPWFGKKLFTIAALGGTPEEIPIELPPTNLLMSCSFSPDGRWIVFEATPASIYVASALGGKPQYLTHGRQPLWRADGAAVIYSDDATGRNFSLWEIPFSPARRGPAPPAQPLTISHGRDLAGSASHDGRRIALTVQQQSSNLELMPFDAEAGRELGNPEAVTAGLQSIYFWSFAPDGRSFVFDSRRGGSASIWRGVRGEPPVLLTGDADTDDTGPQWSPDGATIAFSRARLKNPQAGPSVWVMSADGANPRQVADGTAAKWLPDGRNVIVFSRGQLYRVNVQTNQTQQLTDEPRVMAMTAVSPDGRWVVYQSTASGNVDLRAVPADGGPSRLVIATAGEDYHPFFSPTGRWLYFEPDHKNLYRVPGPAQGWPAASPEKMTHFPESGLSLEDPKTSPDGRLLGFSRGRITGDVWILSRGR